jgi:hypothetical protein
MAHAGPSIPSSYRIRFNIEKPAIRFFFSTLLGEGLSKFYY